MFKVAVDCNSLKNALESVGHLVNKKGLGVNTEVIEMLVTEDLLTIKATDGVTYLTIKIACESDSQGAILTNPAPVLTLLKNLANKKTITLIADKETLTVDLGTKKPYSYRASVGTLGFPELIQPEAFNISAEILKNVKRIESVLDKEKQFLTLKIQKNQTSISGTNGYKLARYRLKSINESEFSLVLTKNTSLLAASLDLRKLEVDRGNRLIRLTGSGGSLVTKQILEPVPDVDLIISTEPDDGVRIETKPVENILRRLQSIDSDATVRVSISGSTISFSAEDVVVGSGEEEVITASTDNKNIIFYVKLSYLLQALEQFETVSIKYTNSTSPVFILNDELLHVIMPVRM